MKRILELISSKLGYRYRLDPITAHSLNCTNLYVGEMSEWRHVDNRYLQKVEKALNMRKNNIMETIECLLLSSVLIDPMIK